MTSTATSASPPKDSSTPLEEPVSADPNATMVKPSRTASTKRRRPPDILTLNIVTVFLGIGIWWAISLTGLQIPSPASVVASGIDLAQRGILLSDIVASLRRVLTGFLLGSALAVPVGFLMGWYGCARGLLAPWLQFFRTKIGRASWRESGK